MFVYTIQPVVSCKRGFKVTLVVAGSVRTPGIPWSAKPLHKPSSRLSLLSATGPNLPSQLRSVTAIGRYHLLLLDIQRNMCVNHSANGLTSLCDSGTAADRTGDPTPAPFAPPRHFDGDGDDLWAYIICPKFLCSICP